MVESQKVQVHSGLTGMIVGGQDLIKKIETAFDVYRQPKEKNLSHRFYSYFFSLGCLQAFIYVVSV